MGAAEYVKHARECMEIAETVPLKDRAMLLDIADAWLRLARIAAADEAKAAPDKPGGDKPK